MTLLFIITLSIFSFSTATPEQNSPIIPFEQNVSNGPVLYVFTGSDWCADCRRLKKNILSEPAFLEAMESNNIVIEIIDFPQRKKLSPEQVKRNESIAEMFDFQGIFPTLVLSQTENKYETLAYKNQNAQDLSTLILEKLNYLNE